MNDQQRSERMRKRIENNPHFKTDEKIRKQLNYGSSNQAPTFGGRPAVELDEDLLPVNRQDVKRSGINPKSLGDDGKLNFKTKKVSDGE